MGMDGRGDEEWLSPFRAAVIYAVFGGLWVLTSDQAVHALPVTTETMSRLRKTNQRLERTVQPTSILHRILRYNLRNACNVIKMNASMLGESDDVEHPSGRFDITDNDPQGAVVRIVFDRA